LRPDGGANESRIKRRGYYCWTPGKKKKNPTPIVVSRCTIVSCVGHDTRIYKRYIRDKEKKKLYTREKERERELKR
jgi:hypothetical protein